jgi:hypothetical protein
MKFFLHFLQKPKPYGPKGLEHKIFENRRPRYSTLKHFRVCSASNEIHSAFSQCAMKFIPRMLSMDLQVKTFHILLLADPARKFVPRMLESFPRMLSMRML